MELEAGIWIAVSLVVLYLVWETVSPILSPPIILAVTLAYILYPPLHERLAERTGNRGGAALIMTAVLTILTFLFIIGFASG